MTADIEKLRAEIEILEKQLETGHFRRLFDPRGQDHELKRLKKMRKQLTEMEKAQKKGKRTKSEE
jgi:hypothetical protein